MEIRLVIFLACVSAAVALNTAIIIAMYKIFAGMTSKVTDAMSEIHNNADAREWIHSLQVAAERAAVLTESTKLSLSEFNPVLSRTQENYRLALVKADSKLDQTANTISTTARDVRDMVAKPAFSVATFAAGVTRALEKYDSEE